MRWPDAPRREMAAPYCFGGGSLYASGFGAVTLGNARGMLDLFIDLARRKTARGMTNPSGERKHPSRRRRRRYITYIRANLSRSNAARDRNRRDARGRPDDESAHANSRGRNVCNSTAMPPPGMSTVSGPMPRGWSCSSARVSNRSPSKRARTGTTSSVPAGNSETDAALVRQAPVLPLVSSVIHLGQKMALAPGTN
jgi:hypothetical protein